MPRAGPVSGGSGIKSNIRFLHHWRNIMSTLLSFHLIAAIRGDGLHPELAALLEKPIPKVAKPVDALPHSEAPFPQIDLKRPRGHM